MVDVNVQHGRFRHRLGVVAARRLRYKALISHHHLICRKEKDVFFLRRLLVDVIRPESPFQNETQVFTHVFIFIVKLALAIGFLLPKGSGKLKCAGVDACKLVECVVENLGFGHVGAGKLSYIQK